MLISTKGRYALRVLIDMAEHQAAGYVPLKEVAARQEISEKYLESIVKTLVKEGILTGLRGKEAAFAKILAQTPSEGSKAVIGALADNQDPGSQKRQLRRTEGRRSIGRRSQCKRTREVVH